MEYTPTACMKIGAFRWVGEGRVMPACVLCKSGGGQGGEVHSTHSWIKCVKGGCITMEPNPGQKFCSVCDFHWGHSPFLKDIYIPKHIKVYRNDSVDCHSPQPIRSLVWHVGPRSPLKYACINVPHSSNVRCDWSVGQRDFCPSES